MNSDRKELEDTKLTVEQLRDRLGLQSIKDVGHLTNALTHSSFVNENSNAQFDNERLEFLGDAVLDFVVGAWAYRHYPKMKEGELTRLRSSLVRTETLAELARKLGIGQAMRLGRGEIISGGRERDVLLCATFEAVVGAIYLSAGLEKAQSFITPFLLPLATEILQKFKTIDPKSRLQEITQSLGFGIPTYITVDSAGPEHSKTFVIEVRIKGEVWGRGEGSSKHSAQLAAAREALETINNNTDIDEKES